MTNEVVSGFPELMVVDGAAHSDAHALGGEAYERRVLGFLERHLDGVAPV